MQSVILSSNQVHRLHHRFYEPTGDVKATLLIVHGMSEHSGRYDAFAKFLAEHGILVATYDQLGHGQTVKDKYELGFFDEKHPVQTLCKDVIIMADKLKEKVPTVPHFIMGHSMGSFIVRTVLVHHATSFDGVILMGTGNRFGLINQLSLGALSLMNRLAPKQINERMGYLLNQYLLNQLRSPISASPFAWLCENIDAIKAFETDPLCGFCFTNNGFVTLQALIARACQSDWYQMMDANYPILLVSGKDDPVGNLGTDIRQLQQALIHANRRNVRVYLYPNMRHEPLHERDYQRVHQDILCWLKDQLNTHSLHQP
ncbi:lysophospholipase [Moraxella sp. FZFQ2102]|uniref:alpha/beta fold hydrolase n=1 Tax=Moraxella sp. FZFQ2102 TaxID=2953752 RepID=UPI00209C189D|nr:alpha/beta fold hydrolase [Moraxella sp. FZFQ2102]USZ14240.1 lysophospholipase [Moraxella sp. FZFQ2102]